MFVQSGEIALNEVSRRYGKLSVTHNCLLVVAALGLLYLANAFAAFYVSTERYIYFWDFSLYWQKFAGFGRLLRTDPATATSYILWSIANEDYTIIPILPLVPFELAFGGGRMSYILAITNMALLPSAALLAWVAERSVGGGSWPRFLISMAAVLCLHVLWAPALRGFPDIFGVAIACAILLAYFGRPAEVQRPLHFIGIGLLLCLLVLTRRWYLFWAVGFFPAAIFAHVLGSPRGRIDWQGFSATGRALVVAAVACCIILVALAAPLVIRMATTDYSAAYAAYRPDLADAGQLGQVAAHFGIALLSVCLAGLGWMATQAKTRTLAVFLIVQAVVSVALFMRVQELFGLQHFYLLAPAAGIGLASAIIALWDARLHPGWRFTGIATVFAVVVTSSAAVFSPTRAAAGPLLPSVHYPPLVRSDLGEIDRLLDTLATLRPKQVYVAASSEILNWDTLLVGCQLRHEDLCSHVVRSADIDTRDGFPKAVVDADYVVLATPTQYHVRPEDQQVVGLVARDIRERRGIGASFEPLPQQFELMRGVRAQIYRRTAPIPDQDTRALSDELLRSYPGMKGLFDPAAEPLR